MTQKQYILYGVEGSYYTAKTRSYLTAKQIPYREILSDRKAYDKEIIPRIGYPIIPIVVTPENQTLQDTSEIFDFLENRHPDPPMVPSTPALVTAAYLLELYADEWLKIPALHYRWYYDFEYAAVMMGENNDPLETTEKKLAVGKKIASRFKSWPKHLGSTEKTKDAIEANFLECLTLFEKHFSEHGFALGDQPTMADCALMGPLYAHLYRDPYSGKILHWKAPHVCRWVEQMRKFYLPKIRPLSTNTPPDTIMTVLRHLSKDCIPTLSHSILLIQEWLSINKDREVPRYVGKHAFTIGRGKSYESTGPRSLHPFDQWKVQRLQKVFHKMSKEDKTKSVQFLEAIGASAILDINITIPLRRENYRLVSGS